VLEFGAVAREFIDRLVMLLLGERLIIDRLVMLLLGVRLIIERLEMLLLGVRLIIERLEMLLLGVRLVIALLDEILLLLEMLEEFILGAALEAEADLETLRLELLDLFDLPLERLLAAKAGSQNSKRANNTLKTRKSGPPRRNLLEF
jgi:hypothetical protein